MTPEEKRREYNQRPEVRERNAAYQRARRQDPAVREGDSRRSKERRKELEYRSKEIERHRLRKYGLAADDYVVLFVTQGGVCASCGSAPAEGKSLCVDHCHITGRVRGLLCTTCNVGLGMFNDDPDRLRAAIAYLNRNAVTGGMQLESVW